MDEKTLQLLDYHKVRDKLAQGAVTPMGLERCRDLLPATDPREVERRQAETAEARRLIEAGPLPLDGLQDIRGAIWWAERDTTLDPAALRDLARTTSAAARLKSYLRARQEQAPTLAAYAAGIGEFSELERAIGQAIAGDAGVRDTAAVELNSVRRAIRALRQEVRKRLEEMARDPGVADLLHQPVVEIRNHTHVLPVRAEHRDKLPGVVHETSPDGTVLFIEPAAVMDQGNEIRQLLGHERREIHRIMAELTAGVRAVAGGLRQTVEAIARIDFARAKAVLGKNMRAVTPESGAGGDLVIRGGRHPFLTGRVVPIDLFVSHQYDILVITGPNTGGKTVTLKTVGLFCLMAQAGLQVPAAPGTRLPVFGQVFADIGDEQSIEQNLSTFSSHMGHIARILPQLAPGALVLLDELGAGTDPAEGAALATAILEHLVGRQVRVIATTHFAELKGLGATHPRVQNAAMGFDLETLRPTYHVQVGVAGTSQALAISARLGLDPAIVEGARRRLPGSTGSYGPGRAP